MNESTGLLEGLANPNPTNTISNPISTLTTADLAREDVIHYLASHIEIHPSGKFCYLANRSFNGNCSIVAFRLDFDYEKEESEIENEIERRGTGDIRYIIGHYSTRGSTPRHFTITPGRGDFLIVGNQDSHTLQVFRVNLETGSLETNESMSLSTPSPACIRCI